MLQDSQERARLQAKFLGWKSVVRLLKVIVTVLILLYVIDSLRKASDVTKLQSIWNEVKRSPEFYLKLAAIVFLCPVNWVLEAWKWKGLLSKVYPVSGTEALKGVLAGLAVGVSVPAQLGDTIGRIVYLKSGQKLKAIGPALVSNGVQFYVSLGVGAICLYLWQYEGVLPAATFEVMRRVLVTSLVLIPVLARVLIAYLKGRTNAAQSNRFINAVQAIQLYTAKQLTWALLLGFARYVVFITQFVLAINLFNGSVEMEVLFVGVGVVYLIKTLLPTLNAFTDLGLREISALWVFKNYQLGEVGLATSTLLIWVINILIPILVGLGFIWRRRFRQNFESGNETKMESK